MIQLEDLSMVTEFSATASENKERAERCTATELLIERKPRLECVKILLVYLKQARNPKDPKPSI